MKKLLKLDRIKPLNKSGSDTRKKGIRVVKRRHYRIQQGYSMTGEAPKEFVKIYKYGKGRAVNPKSWSSYIVKSSLKWYPTESIIE